MKTKGLIIFLILMIVGIFVLAKNSTKEQFSLAKNLPQEALVYAQINDLPAFIKLIKESSMSEKYLESQNYLDFQNSHLGIKLAERLTDVNQQTNIPIDLPFISNLSEKQAAVAIYDIGKLDLVLVAPMNETIFSASILLQKSERFIKESLKDGTNYYRQEVLVDRGRQNQNLIFANINGYFVLTTSEKLFAETHRLIVSKQTKNSLFNQESFSKLSERITSNLATIWINQEKLNSDYYFKRYWLMSDTDKLKNIQAGIFDLQLDENGLIEKREFLLKDPNNKNEISSSEIKDLLSKVSDDVPFFEIKKVDEKQLGEAIYKTLFDKEFSLNNQVNRSHHASYLDDYYYQPSYYYLNSSFDETIDEKPDNESQETNNLPILSISNSLNSAQPSSILIATKPKTLEYPLFADFQKIAIIHLNNPKEFNAQSFENSIIENLKKRITVANSSFSWKTENNLRQLNIPLLGWEITYQINKNKLFISNSFEFLNESLSNQTKTEIKADNLNSLTIIRLTNQEENFDQIMQSLTKKENEESNFFIDNIGSLLSVLEEVKQIEISRKYDGDFLKEEIVFKKSLIIDN